MNLHVDGRPAYPVPQQQSDWLTEFSQFFLAVPWAEGLGWACEASYYSDKWPCTLFQICCLYKLHPFRNTISHLTSTKMSTHLQVTQINACRVCSLTCSLICCHSMSDSEIWHDLYCMKELGERHHDNHGMWKWKWKWSGCEEQKARRGSQQLTWKSRNFWASSASSRPQFPEK